MAILIFALVKKGPGSSADALYKGPGETNLDLDSPENTLFLDLNDGRVVIQMRPDLAPFHVARIKKLVRQKYYDGLNFHRVIEDFMAQGGDPMGNGTGGSGVNIGAEFSKEKFVRGVVGMARNENDNGADSQFFIMLGDARWLDNQYTVWGIVSDGMDFVDGIKIIDSSTVGTREYNPDKIVRMQIAADVTE
ncbi:MAG: peptidylprolyl isomerase [Rhodospirillaceae bacterium]|nr:MAG: peptidylprolyl isomerase [Rhodospirillaceae bacterium]